MPACQWHPYEGDAEQVSYFRKKHPECENHWTEGNFIPFLFGKGLDSGGEALACGYFRRAGQFCIGGL